MVYCQTHFYQTHVKREKEQWVRARAGAGAGGNYTYTGYFTSNATCFTLSL